MSLLIFVCDTQAEARQVVIRYGEDKVVDVGTQPVEPVLVYEGPDETVAPKLDYTGLDKWVVVINA